MYPAWYAETFPQRERSNPAAYASLPPPLKGVRCSSLNARRSFARKAAPAFAGGPRRRLPGRRATSPRSTFSGSFPEVVLRVGLACARQLVPEVPVDPGDVPVHALATEEGVIRVVEASGSPEQ